MHARSSGNALSKSWRLLKVLNMARSSIYDRIVPPNFGPVKYIIAENLGNRKDTRGSRFDMAAKNPKDQDVTKAATMDTPVTFHPQVREQDPARSMLRAHALELFALPFN